MDNAFLNKEERRIYEYKDHKIKFFFGDLNFRINMSYEEAVELSTNSWCTESLLKMQECD